MDAAGFHLEDRDGVGDVCVLQPTEHHDGAVLGVFGDRRVGAGIAAAQGHDPFDAVPNVIEPLTEAVAALQRHQGRSRGLGDVTEPCCHVPDIG